MFGALAAVWFLKERMLLKRWLAVLTGFSGMLIILRPGLIEVSNGSMIVLFSAFCWGIGMVIVKKLTETEVDFGSSLHSNVHPSGPCRGPSPGPK